MNIFKKIKAGKKALDFTQVAFSLKGELAELEKLLEKEYSSDVATIPRISEYLIGGGGKRIRPLLLFLTARLAGYTGERILPLACAIEYIHAATLLHDDVIDEAETRRKKTSANIIFGNHASILVGDFLFSKSFEIVAEDGDIRIVRALSSATSELAEGEIMELELTGNLNLDEKTYLEMIYRKTGTLISACCKIAGFLGELSEKEVQALERFGRGIGNAFQIADDILDFVADQSDIGKPTGNDLQEKKVTLPVIELLKRCSAEEKAEIERIYAKEKPDNGDFTGIKKMMEEHDIFNLCRSRAEEIKEDALQAFSCFQGRPHYDEIVTVAHFILSRTH